MADISSFVIEMPHFGTTDVPTYEQWQELGEEERPGAARRAASAWEGQVLMLNHLLRSLHSDVTQLGEFLDGEDWQDSVEFHRKLRSVLGSWGNWIPQTIEEARMLLISLGGTQTSLEQRVKTAQSERDGWLIAASDPAAPLIDPAAT